MPVKVEAAVPEAAPWLPQPSVVSYLSEMTARPIHVYLYPRRLLARAWADGHGGRPPPAFTPYQFRAWATPDLGRVTILVDRTETPLSVTWVLLHELAHHELRASPFVAGALEATVRHKAYMTSDRAHQADPEEKIADWVATRWFRRLGFPRPWRLDRDWWRRQMRRRRDGTPAG